MACGGFLGSVNSPSLGLGVPPRLSRRAANDPTLGPGIPPPFTRRTRVTNFFVYNC